MPRKYATYGRHRQRQVSIDEKWLQLVDDAPAEPTRTNTLKEVETKKKKSQEKSRELFSSIELFNSFESSFKASDSVNATQLQQKNCKKPAKKEKAVLSDIQNINKTDIHGENDRKTIKATKKNVGDKEKVFKTKASKTVKKSSKENCVSTKKNESVCKKNEKEVNAGPNFSDFDDYSLLISESPPLEVAVEVISEPVLKTTCKFTVKSLPANTSTPQTNSVHSVTQDDFHFLRSFSDESLGLAANNSSIQKSFESMHLSDVHMILNSLVQRSLSATPNSVFEENANIESEQRSVYGSCVSSICNQEGFHSSNAKRVSFINCSAEILSSTTDRISFINCATAHNCATAQSSFRSAAQCTGSIESVEQSNGSIMSVAHCSGSFSLFSPDVQGQHVEVSLSDEIVTDLHSDLSACDRSSKCFENSTRSSPCLKSNISKFFSNEEDMSCLSDIVEEGNEEMEESVVDAVKELSCVDDMSTSSLITAGSSHFFTSSPMATATTYIPHARSLQDCSRKSTHGTSIVKNSFADMEVPNQCFTNLLKSLEEADNEESYEVTPSKSSADDEDRINESRNRLNQSSDRLNQLSDRLNQSNDIRKHSEYRLNLMKDKLNQSKDISEQVSIQSDVLDSSRQSKLQKSNQSFKILTPVKLPNSERLLSPLDKILLLCHQTTPVDFSSIISSSNADSCVKIGEGVYGEVYRMVFEGESLALKVIPIEGKDLVNGEKQKLFEEILPEIVISEELSSLRNHENQRSENFVHVKGVWLIQDCYPEILLERWDEFNKTKGSENDRPDVFKKDQLFIVFMFEDSGTSLESFELADQNQAIGILKQVTISLAIAEKSLEFEHRDLHWGNILVRSCDESSLDYILDGQTVSIPTYGVKVTIIDFTLSRLCKDGCIVFTDLSVDETLFTGKGDYQFDVYRLMKQENGNLWDFFEPFTNVLWINYLIGKLSKEVAMKKKKDTALLARTLRGLQRHLLNYGSSCDLWNGCPFFQD